jgi:hypothetical protein
MTDKPTDEKVAKVVVREYYEFEVTEKELQAIEDDGNVCDFYEDTDLVAIDIYEIKRDEESE